MQSSGHLAVIKDEVTEWLAIAVELREMDLVKKGTSRRGFLRVAGTLVCSAVLPARASLAEEI
jgi:hypothetical protein